MSSRAFRFGVTAHNARSLAVWKDTVRKVADLGYSSLMIPDHFGEQLAPVPALAVAADTDERIRVGMLVACNDFRHPVVAAKELATLDLLTDGRLDWGMGAGWLPSDYDRSGIQMDPPGVRVSRLTEAVMLMKALFGEEPVSHKGDYYSVTDLDGYPKPLQKPHPPLLVGAARRRMLGLAGREADIVGIAPSLTTRSLGGRPPRESMVVATDNQLSWIRQAAGDRFESLEMSMVVFPVVVTDRPAERIPSIAKGLGIDPEQVRESPHIWIGSVEEICEAVNLRRSRWGVSYWVVPQAAMDAAAPIVDRLRGR